MRCLRVGPDALLVEVEDTVAAMALYDEARRRRVAAVDVVPGARTVLFDGVRDVSSLEEDLRGWEPRPRDVGAGRRTVEVPTTYDGEDLDVVARLWGMTPHEVVEAHTSASMVVAFCGFSPGFAYCTGLDVPRPVPRRDSPRTRVPAGAVGLAGGFTGVYPSASPGGWQLIGHTDLRLWDHTRDDPATLAPGTPVRFVEAGS